MGYKYDNYGWYVGEAEGARCADIAPVNLSTEAIDGELRSNWTGYEWVELPYAAPGVEQDAPVAVPESITPRQGRIILARYGMLAAVDGYFSTLTGEGADVAKIEWEYASEWRRDWTVLTVAATSFGLTTEQIDQMFIAAAAL